MSDIRVVLENLGYKLSNDGHKYYRAKPLYRDSGNNTSLRISKKNGFFVDYSAQIKGSLADLVKLTLQLKTVDDAKSWLANNEFELNFDSNASNSIIEDAAQYYDSSLLSKLLKHHEYWMNRGVPENIISQYNGGIVIGEGHSLSGRYVIPIFNDQNRIIGFAGRDITGKKKKWKLIGKKSEWVFPINNIQNIREKREIILLESIGDLLALETQGINTGLVLFGVSLSDKILSKLVGLNPKHIIISLNNDQNNGEVGQKNALKIAERLSQFFDPQNITISLPQTAKDFGEMNEQQIKDWYEQTIHSNSGH
jgi:hypothetical protein